MKLSVPLKVSLLLAVLLSFDSIFAQSSINGGSITTASVCATRTTPASDLTSVTSATGGTAPYTYQWEAKIDYSNWTNVINVGNGLNLSPGILLYNTVYRRKVTDAAGSSAYSNEISLFLTDVFNAGNISLQGSPFVLTNEIPPVITTSAATSGTGSYSYTWETSNVSPTGPWSVINGETGLTYQPSPFTTTGIKYFRKKATDLSCGIVTYTNVIQIEAVLTLPFEKGYWTYQYPCVFAGSLPSFLLGHPSRGGTPPYTYQWEERLETETSWHQISGATSVSYQPGIITASTYYRRKATDAAGATGYSNEDLVAYVSTSANAGTIASNQSSLIAPNAPLFAIINVTSASNFYNGHYYWQTSLDNGANWSTVNDYSYSYYFPNVQPASSTCYRRAIREVCASSERDTWSNIVCFNPAPLVDGIISYGSGNSGCVTASSLPGTITGTPATGGATPYTYKWQSFDGIDWVDIASSNLVSYTPGPLNHDAKFRRIVTDANGTSLTSNEIYITISSNAPLKGGLIDGPIVTCSNTAPGIINNIIDACGGGGAFTYTWEASINSGGSWLAIGGANQPTYNATSIANTTKYRRKVGDGCGNAVYSNEVEVFVYPAIEAGSIAPATQTICTNRVPELLGLTQNCHYTNGNVTYQWQRSTNANGPWTNISGATQPVLLPKVLTTSTYFRLVVRSSVCNAEAISNVSSVIVNSNCSSGRTAQGISTDNILSSNLSGKGSLKLYPNPVSKGQTVFVTFDGDGANCKASLRGTDGRVYNCTVEAASKGSLQVKMPVNIAQGTYLIQLTNGQKQWVERIVIY